MELCGIVLSVPAALVLMAGYGTLLMRWMPDEGGLRRLFYFASVAILILFSVELIMLAILGAIRSRALIGPAYYLAHLGFFFLGTPALANAIVLGWESHFLRRPYIVATICTPFALLLVLVQYGVAEALYGTSERPGPYSDHPRSLVIIFSPNPRPPLARPSQPLPARNP